MYIMYINGSEGMFVRHVWLVFQINLKYYLLKKNMFIFIIQNIAFFSIYIYFQLLKFLLCFRTFFFYSKLFVTKSELLF